MAVPVPSWGIDWKLRRRGDTAWCSHCGWTGLAKDLRKVTPRIHNGCPQCDYLANHTMGAPRVNALGYLYLFVKNLLGRGTA